MDRLTSKYLKQLLDFLRSSYACHEQEAFVTYLLGAVPTLIPSEVTSYAELNLMAGRVEDGTRVVPADTKFSGNRELFEAHCAEHPLTTYTQQTCDGRAVNAHSG